MTKNRTNDSGLSDESQLSALFRRLDAIVFLLLPQNLRDKGGNVKVSAAAPFLQSLGYAPAEIAKMFGKKSSTEIAPYLYSKKKVARDDKPRTT